ncbi:DNA-directed RNA polymerase subunit H [Candidatus Bathyarchaeota archaeon]|jgi:DNA-directed RNA polymerase subunit H|nr:MAG: DNA-directed RNA polymerase subunit H [Candidatus Bathyarchaeota archaeon]
MYVYLPQKKYNLFNHVLVPKHILLTEEEAQSILKQYRIKPYQLPHIKASDPGARAIDAKTGNIIKIMRKSPTAGKAIAYRYVVD